MQIHVRVGVEAEALVTVGARCVEVPLDARLYPVLAQHVLDDAGQAQEFDVEAAQHLPLTEARQPEPRRLEAPPHPVAVDEQLVLEPVDVERLWVGVPDAESHVEGGFP